MKIIIPALLVALAFAGCTSETPSSFENNEGEVLQPMTKTLVLGEDLTGHNGILDWSTQDWLLGNAPPTYEYQFNETVRITSAIAEIEYNFPNLVIGGGVRTELTTWHGIRADGDYMTAHRFYDAPDQHAGGVLTGLFDMEIPAGGLLIPAGNSYVFSVGHYYTDGIGPNAPQATGYVDITYETATAPMFSEPTRSATSLQGGLCAVPADINARLDVPLSIESTEGLRIRVEGNNGILGDVDFFVSGPEGTMMHGAGPGSIEDVTIGPEGFGNLTVGDEVTLTVFNCHPQLSDIDYHIYWAQT